MKTYVWLLLLLTLLLVVLSRGLFLFGYMVSDYLGQQKDINVLNMSITNAEPVELKWSNEERIVLDTETGKLWRWDGASWISTNRVYVPTNVVYFATNKFSAPYEKQVELYPPLKTDRPVRWFNHETALEEVWRHDEHTRMYGTNNWVMFPYVFNTNVAVAIGVGTNRQSIEFGFREDGVVVWREKK